MPNSRLEPEGWLDNAKFFKKPVEHFFSFEFMNCYLSTEKSISNWCWEHLASSSVFRARFAWFIMCLGHLSAYRFLMTHTAKTWTQFSRNACLDHENTQHPRLHVGADLFVTLRFFSFAWIKPKVLKEES